MSNRDGYTGIKGSKVGFKFPKQKEETEILLSISEISFTKRGLSGFAFKFEPVFISGLKSLAVNDKGLPTPNCFQFRYETSKKLMHGEFSDHYNFDLSSQRIDNSEIQDDERMHTHYSDIKMDGLTKSEALKEVDRNQDKIIYGAGLKTMRLFQNKLIDLEEENSDDEEGSEENEEGQKDGEGYGGKKEEEELDEDGEGEGSSSSEFQQNFKSRKNLANVLNELEVPATIKNVKYVGNILTIIIIALAFSDYFIVARLFQSIEDNLDYVVLSRDRIGILEKIKWDLRDMVLVKRGIFGPMDDTNTARIQGDRDKIHEVIVELESIQKKLQINTMSTDKANLDLFLNNNIKMYFSKDEFKKYGLNEATQQMISKAFNFKNADLDHLVADNPDFFFFTYNGYNDYYIALRASAENYLSTLILNNQEKINLVTNILIASIIVLFASAIITIPVLYKVNQTKAEVLRLFLDIPDKVVKILHSRCEIHYSSMQLGEDDEDVLETEQEADEEMNETKHNEDEASAQLDSKKKVKKFKNTNNTQGRLIMAVFFVVLLLQGYFIYSFIAAKVVIQQVNTLLPELNETAWMTPATRVTLNIQRHMLFDNTLPVWGNDILNSAFKTMNDHFDVYVNLFQEQNKNSVIHSQYYTDCYQNVILKDPCPILESLKLTTLIECKAFSGGSAAEGLSSAMTRCSENIRSIIQHYITFLNNPDESLPKAINSYEIYRNLSSDVRENKTLNLFNTRYAVIPRTTTDVYIEGGFKYLIQAFQNSLSDLFANKDMQKLAVFICFNIVVVLIYFAFWLPLAVKMSKDIWRTNNLLLIIPISVISEIKSMRLFIRKILNKSG